MKNIIISKFKNFKSNEPTNISLLDWLIDETYKESVIKIRAISEKEEITRLKSQLPCVTISGLFTIRKADSLVKHSGYICVDIDGKDNPHLKDYKQVRDELRKIKNIAYLSLSVSGNGVFCLIPINFPEKHKEHFEALKIQFSNIGITIDKACSDVSRLRIYSYDEEAYFNEEAIVFNQVFEYKFDIPKLPENEIIERTFSNDESTYSKVLKVVNQINNSGIDITEEYSQWFQIGCSLANEFGEDGRELFHIVSQYHPKYHVESCDNFYSNCIQGNYSNIGIGTFFHWAKEYHLN